MKRLLWGLITAVATLAVLLGAALLLGNKKEQEVSQPPETTAAVTEAVELTIATEAETLPTVETEAAAETLPVEASAHDTVPKYYQTDYPYIKFGNGTMATSGCSVTCLAMVATYLTDQEYTPPQMAYHFGHYGKTNIERLDYGISQMQLPYQRTENIQEVLTALRSGKVAILMMDDESVFTNEQHFIVAAGMTNDGKFIVNDPLETNYTKSDLHVRNSYDSGFADYYLIQGFSGGWIFDKADMGENFFRFDASMPEQQENRYDGYQLTDDDIYTLACFVWAEARDEAPMVQQAVAEVVLNRVVSDKYPNTVQEMVRKTEFYRSLDAMTRLDEPELDQYIAVDAAMYGPYVLPEDICFYSVWETGEGLWGTLGSYTFYKER